MRVLIACEYSGVVRSAFAALGHTAVSCDLLPTDNPRGWHVRGDGRQQEALEFVRALLNAPIPRIALENPVSVISSEIRKPDQVVHPYMFGHLERKTTCLWLKGLSPLRPTHDLKAETMALPANQRDRVHYMPPSVDRWKKRSTTYAGIAAAMAAQWGRADRFELEAA